MADRASSIREDTKNVHYEIKTHENPVNFFMVNSQVF